MGRQARRWKSTALGILWGFGFLLAAGVSGAQEAQAEAGSGCLAVVTMRSTGYGFWQQVQAGAQSVADGAGVPLFQRAVEDTEADAFQRVAIQASLRHGCTALVLAPDSPNRNRDVAELAALGIPTVFVDRDTDGHSRAVSLVATDNRAAAALAARALAERLPKGSRVLILGLTPLVVTTVARADGLAIEAEILGLSVVGQYYIGLSVGAGRNNVAELIEKGAFEGIDALFTTNESSTLALLLEMTRHPMADPPLIIGFDINPYIAEAIRRGTLEGVVVQRAFDMGQQAARTALAARKGETVPPVIRIPAAFISAAELDAPFLRPYLASNDTPGE